TPPRTGGRPLRTRGSLRRVAPLLRAPLRRLPHRPRLRGHAVGRRVSPRLHRVPAGVVALLPTVRRNARPSGATRAPSRVGGGNAQFHLALPRAAPRARNGGAPRRSRSGSAGDTQTADPRAGRGHPA